MLATLEGCLLCWCEERNWLSLVGPEMKREVQNIGKWAVIDQVLSALEVVGWLGGHWALVAIRVVICGLASPFVNPSSHFFFF